MVGPKTGGPKVMNREEKLFELARITKRLRDLLGSERLPEAYVQGYNQLMTELFHQGEDLKLKEEKHE